MSMLELTLIPLRAGLVAGQDNTLDVMVRGRAPAAPDRAMPTVRKDLAFVIDRSGSMQGRPLEEAKLCIMQILDRMAPTDRASIIAYDNRVEVVAPLQPVSDKAALRALIGAIEAGGNTALHAGWRAGAQSLDDIASGTGIARVLLLSDGQANNGLTEPDPIAAECARFAARGVTTSTYGLGHHFNEDLMSAMARAGRGSAYYGDTAEDLIDPMQQELDLLSALFARGLRLTVRPKVGITASVRNTYPVLDGRYVLPDIAFGSDVTAMLRLVIPAAAVGAVQAGTLRVVSVDLVCELLEDQQLVSTTAHLDLAVLGQSAFAGLAEDEVVRRRLTELRAAEIQREARDAARAEDWQRVDELLGEIRLLAGDNQWVMATVDALEALSRRRDRQGFSKEAHYKFARMQTRLSASDEDGLWAARSEVERPSFLRRKQREGKRID